MRTIKITEADYKLLKKLAGAEARFMWAVLQEALEDYNTKKRKGK